MKRITSILIFAIFLGMSIAIYYARSSKFFWLPHRSKQTLRIENTPTIVSKKDYGLTYGKKTAPHHLINFFDMGCTHCKTFFRTTWPIIRMCFVETGKLQVTFTPYPIHTETLMFMTCTEKLIAIEQQILFEILMETDTSAMATMEQSMETFRKSVVTPTPKTIKEALFLTRQHEFTELPMLFLDGKQLSNTEQDHIINFLEESLK